MKDQIKKLIASGNTKQALLLAKEFFEKTNHSFQAKIYMLLNQFNSIKNDKRLGLIDSDNEINRIVQSLLELIDQYDSESEIFDDRLGSQQAITNRNRLVIIACTALIMAFVGYYAIKKSFSNDSLFNKYYSMLEPSILMSREYQRNSELVFLEPCRAFSEGRYEDSKRLYEGIRDSLTLTISDIYGIDNQGNTLANTEYAIALNNLYLGEIQDAKRNFDSYISAQSRMIGNNPEVNVSEWGRLLCKLKMEEIDDGFWKDLSKIINNKLHLFNKQGVQLERKLQSPFRRILGEYRS